MNYCNKCVQPDTRPSIHFTGGICDACLHSELKPSIYWRQREAGLDAIVQTVKCFGTKTPYQFVCGVSGGKDSTYTALYARDKLGLRTLLVNSEPEGITEIGKKNIENLKNLGFDCVSLRPNPLVMKELVRRDFYKHLNPVKVTEFSLWSSAYIIAQLFDIYLIIQGENPALTLGVDCLPSNYDALWADSQDTLKSGWRDYAEYVHPNDLFMFHYDAVRLRQQHIKAIWLQYYDKDWSPRRNADFAIKNGMMVREDFNPEDIGTYVDFAQLDNDITPLNQMLKYYKLGFGQCTDYACYDIRDGLITRDEGIELVEKYDGKCHPKYIKKFCDYIDITESEFWRVVDRFVNRGLFIQEPNTGAYLPTFRVGVNG